MMLFLLFAFAIFAGVKEIQTTEVNMPKFGVYRSETTDIYHSVNKFQESQSKMDGKGFWGNLAAKFMTTGKRGTILNLTEKMTYSIDYDKKTYNKKPIEKFIDESGQNAEADDAENDNTDQSESRYRIIRQELHVKDGKKREKINQFDANGFNIIYILEKEEIQTKKRFTDSLYVSVFTSEDAKIFAKANEIKSEHNKAILEAIGLQIEEEQYNQMLGLNWIGLLSMMDKDMESSKMEIDYTKLQKITGYPVMVDGSYYKKEYDPAISSPKPQEKKKLGGFGLGNIIDKVAESAQESSDEKKAAKNNQYQLVLSYKTETKDIVFDSFPDKFFSSPEGFKEVK